MPGVAEVIGTSGTVNDTGDPDADPLAGGSIGALLGPPPGPLLPNAPYAPTNAVLTGGPDVEALSAAHAGAATSQGAGPRHTPAPTHGGPTAPGGGGSPAAGAHGRGAAGPQVGAPGGAATGGAGTRTTQRSAPALATGLWGRAEQQDFRSRVRGALLGAALGDAFGAPLAGLSLDAVRAAHGPLGLTGPAPAHGRRGAVTAATQLTLFSVRVQGCYTPN